MDNSSPHKLPFGLFELDLNGAVIRYSPAAEREADVKAQDVLGRHFFTEIVQNQQMKDFQTRFHLFMTHGQTIDRFSTSFRSEEGQVKVQILLARIKETAKDGSERLALARIMPE